MAVSKERASLLEKKIIDSLIKEQFIVVGDNAEELIKDIDEILYGELTVDQRLNAEVRRLLEKYESEIEKGRLDYRSLFEMTKKKLARERNIIL
jgi:hypothetical protein